MPSVNRNQTEIIASLRKAADALEKHCADGTVILARRTWTAEDLVAAIRHHIEQRATARSLYCEWLRVTRELQAVYTDDLAPALIAMRAILAAQYGADSQVFFEFGFVAKRRLKPSSKTAAAAVEKRLATRKARGTMGKRQRLAIKGVVTRPADLPAPSAPKQLASADGADAPDDGSGASR